jgi:hypothetical protein
MVSRRAVLALAAVSAAAAQNSSCNPTAGNLYSGFYSATLLSEQWTGASSLNFKDWNGNVTLVMNVASF